MAVMFDAASQLAFGDSAGLKEFSLAHRLAHSSNATAISASTGAALPGFDVGDERVHAEWALLMKGKIKHPTQAMRDWLTLHSLLHEAEYAQLGFGLAPNLIDVDFADQGQFSDWMLSHQQAHDLVASTLGVP